MNCSLRGRAEPGPLRLLVGTESVWSHGFVLLSTDTLNEPACTEYSSVHAESGVCSPRGRAELGPLGLMVGTSSM